MHKKSKNRTAICLFLLVFMLSTSSFTSLFMSNHNNFDSDINLETSGTNYLFNGKEYDITLDDVYDDVDPYKIYTGANFSYVFLENDTITFEEEVSPVNNSERYSTSPSGHYPATYSFTDEVDGTSGSDINFIASSSLDTCEIVFEDANHKKVLFIGSTVTSSATSQTFTNQVSGTIEFWARLDSGTRFQIVFVGSATAIQIMFYNNQVRFYYGDGAGGDDSTNVVVDSNYYVHIRIDFDCGTDTYDGYCNGILIVEDVNFYRDNDVSYINFLLLSINTANSYGYIDAIGYSWDSDYNIRDNLYNPPVSMLKGTFDGADNMKEYDGSFTSFYSSDLLVVNNEMPIQWTDFAYTYGSSGGTGSTQYNDGTYAYMNSASYGTETYLGYIKPADSDLISNWNEGDGTPHYNKLDEWPDSDGDGGNIRESTTGVDDRWNFGTLGLPANAKVTKLVVNMYVKHGLTAEPRTVVSFTSNVGVSGKFGGGNNVYAWASKTTTGLSLTQTQLNDLWINVEPYNYPTGDYCWVDIETVYIQVYYTVFYYRHYSTITWDYTGADLDYLDTLYYDYATTVAIDMDLDIWDWVAGSYNVELQSNTGTGYITGSYDLQANPNKVSGSNQVKVRFETSGTTTTDFDVRIDQLMFDYVLTTDGENQIEAVIDPDFVNYNDPDLLGIEVESWHKTDVAQTITFSIYNYDTTNWETITSQSQTSFTQNLFQSTSVSDYFDGSGKMKIKYYGTSAVQVFDLYVDNLNITITYKMDLTHSITFYTNGLWKYRWVLFGSIQYTDWTVFEVIDPIPNFYAISESELTTRWILQNASLIPLEDFHDDINTDYWNLVDVSENCFEKYISEASNYLLDNSSNLYTETHFDVGVQDITPYGITWDGTHFWIVGENNRYVYKYTSTGTYTGTSFGVFAQDSIPRGITWDGTHFWVVGASSDYVFQYSSAGVFTGTDFYVGSQDNWPCGITWDGTHFWILGMNGDEVYKYTSTGTYTGTHFDVRVQTSDPYGIAWDGTHFLIVGNDGDEVYQYTSAGVYTGVHFDVGTEDTAPQGITWDGTHFWMVGNANNEVYKYYLKYDISKNYFGAGYTYMQTNKTESISLRSIDYTTHYNLSSGDYFEVDFQTISDSKIELILLKDGVVNKILTLSQSGNTNFERHTAKISVSEFVEFDQLKISSTFEDEDYVKVYDVKTYKYTVIGDSANFLVGSKRDREIYLTPGIYNLRINEEGDEKVNINRTIPAAGVLQYVYTPTATKQCRIAFFNPQDIPLAFTDYHVYINRSLGGSYSPFTLLENIFSVDVDTTVYIEIKDRFNTLIRTYEKEITPTTDYLDIELLVYQLQIKNLMEQQTTVYINVTHVYPLLSGDSLHFMLSKAYYQIGFYDEYDLYKNFTINLISNQAYQLNSSLKTIYFSMFTYDGLGIDHDLVRFYINGERKDFGFNSMLEDTLELVILDFFNNTLANETIDASAYSEYNLFVEIYSLIILNQFTYEDILVNITQVDSGIWMAQIIPKQFGLTYRFLPNVEYNITIYFTNATLYSSRIVNLTDNSHIESFGVPTQPEEYPKQVYFGVYTTTGLGINPYLLRFYIDGTRTDFGFNRIENQIVGLVVKDYFNTTLFNQNVNTSGIYEYNILITLYSLKVKNEARISTNYTLKRGGLETTGFILPDEIIEYQLATNNYVFDYTNNEDGSFDTININLNQDRVYILNSTYYNIYFSLFDLNLHNIDPNQYVFKLNDTREAFGLIEDLQTDDYTITITDRFGTFLFNDVVSLRGLNEYVINITLYELQIRHLASENSDLVLTEDVSGTTYTFIMTPDSIKSIIIGSADYTLNWTNGENAQITLISIALTTDRVVMLNSTYYDVYFSLYDQNGVRLDDSLFSLYLNGSRKDFGFVNLESVNVLIVVQDYLNFTAFNSIIVLSEFNEYNIIITVYELQIRHLAQENSNFTLYETTTHNCINFSMSPDSLNKYVLSGSTYNITWVNGENGVSTFYGIILNDNYILTLDSTYYDIYFSLYDLNLHTIDPNLYEFRLNGTREVLGFVEDLQTDDYAITIVDRFGTSLFDNVVSLRGLNEYMINVSLYELQIRHLAFQNSKLTLYETTIHNGLNFSMAPDTIRSFVLGSSTYNVTWTNGETGIAVVYDINLNSDYILTLNTSYYDIYFSLFDLNLHTIDPSLYEFRLNGTIQDFGLITDLQTNNYTITVTDRFGTSLFNNIITLRGLNEYRIDVTLYELQIRHLATENSNMSLYETTIHNGLNFSMAPDTIRSFILAGSSYNITWTNGETGIAIVYDINLNSDYILTLDTTYYDIYFSLFDLNLHAINSYQYEFRLNGTIHDFGLVVGLQTDDYTITVIDRFGTSLFNNIVNLRGLNEYRIDVTLFELQIRHLAMENSNLTLYETTIHNSLNFLMAPDTLLSFILGSSTYNITWINGENGVTTVYDINLNSDYILTLDTTYYDIYFSLFDLNLHVIDSNQYIFRLNGTIQDFGLITGLQTDDYSITIVDRFGTSLFNSIITLRGLNEYRINITLYELQIRYLARENGNLTLSETTGHSSLDFNMAPDTTKSFILGSSTYNVTWLNNENGITTTYDINLISDYILTLNTSYYNIYFSLFDLNLHMIDLSQYEFRLNGTIQDFGLIVDLQTDGYTISVIDRFGVSLFNNIVNLRGLNEYRIDVTLYELQIRHLARENSDLTLTEDVSGTTYTFIMTPDSIKSIIVGSADYTLSWTNGENAQITLISIALTTDRVVLLNTSYYNVYFSLFDLNLHNIDLDLYEFRLNGTIQDFGLIVDLQSDDYNITVIDRFGTSLFDNIITLRDLNEYRIDVTLYELQIRHLATENSNLILIEDVSGNDYLFIMTPDSIKSIVVGSADYTLNWTNGENGFTTSIPIVLTTDRVVMLNTTYHDVYFSVFTYDGLGIDHDLIRFYINGERKDFGFNTIQSETAYLVVLDFFNNTLANKTIDASAYSEYNLFVEIYSMIILNQFTYEDILVNITQVGSEIWMAQIIPKQFGLTYRFLPNIEYNITVYFTNATLYSSRIVNLTDNSHIESFGVPTLPLEYPKQVYFGVYTTTGLGINPYLLRFYIDGNRTDFGFNMIENMIVTLVVKDYFNSTLFNQNVNTSGIYEYNILITLYSLKVKNEARIATNYTLKLGGLETTGYILPDEIIEYQLATNNYVFDYTNNEDGSFGTISINLNQDRVYILNSTYYEVYIGLYNFYGIVNPEEVKFYINNTRTDFGFNTIKSEYANLLVLDYFDSILYNQTVRLSGLEEYGIFIQAYTLVVNNLYNNQSITIKITRGSITIERLIEAQGWTEFKLFANITYEITSYINGTMDEEKDVVLDEEYKTVDFGFYSTEVPYDPEPLVFDTMILIAFIIIICVFGWIIVIAWAYIKKDRDVVPEDTRLIHKRKRKAIVDRKKGFYDHT